MTNILVTANIDHPIKQEVGFVSITDAKNLSDSIAKLEVEVVKLGGNALILLRTGSSPGDTCFSTHNFFAYGVAVEV